MSDIDKVKEELKTIRDEGITLNPLEQLAKEIIKIERKVFYGTPGVKYMEDIRELIAKAAENAD